MADEVAPGTWNNQRVPGGELPAATSRHLVSLIAPVIRHNPRGSELEIYFINAVSDGETWISRIPNIIAVAWQPDVADTDEVGVTVIDQPTGEIYFAVGALSPSGWLWMLRGK